MALQMSNATNAVSNKGVDNIIIKLQDQIDAILRAVEGPEYKEFMTVVENNWSGASKDAFKKDLNSKITTMKADLTKMRSQVAADITATKNTFISADAKIYDANRK